ncbi:MAG TPA: MarR family transcriptional regulator [Gammaproteobacteria bacterium]|nr:MarR family transcriptional regulator [Gammaproteobacteria bacterium]
MSTAKKMDVTGLLGYKLKKTQHALRLHMDEVLRKLNLTTPQYSVLAQLELERGMSNAELARRSFITAQTMHGIVSNLEQRKLIMRKNDPGHGRILCAELTSQGLQIVQKAHHLIRNIEEQMTATVHQGDKQLLDQLLSECLFNLNNLTKE